MDDIDFKGRIVNSPDQTMISERIHDKGGQGNRPQYVIKKRPPANPPPEEEAQEEPGKEKHLIDIKV